MVSFSMNFDPTLARLVDAGGSYSFSVPSSPEEPLTFAYNLPGRFFVSTDGSVNEGVNGIIVMPSEIWTLDGDVPDPLQEECILEMLMFFLSDGLLSKDVRYLVVQEEKKRFSTKRVMPVENIIALEEQGYDVAAGCQTKAWSELVGKLGGKEHVTTLDIANVDGHAGWGRYGNRLRLFRSGIHKILPMYLAGVVFRYVPGAIEYFRPTSVDVQDAAKIRCAKEMLGILGSENAALDEVCQLEAIPPYVSVPPMYFAEMSRLFVAGMPFGQYREALHQAYDMGCIWKAAIKDVDVPSPFTEDLDPADVVEALKQYAFDIGLDSTLEALDAGVPAEDVLLDELVPWVAP